MEVYIYGGIYIYICIYIYMYVYMYICQYKKQNHNLTRKMVLATLPSRQLHVQSQLQKH